MIQTLMPVPAPPAPKRCNLLLHCGSQAVEVAEIGNVPLPRSTRSWQPVPHDAVLGAVTGALADCGMHAVSGAHALSHDGARYFGLLEVTARLSIPESSWVVGVRNSHDKRFSAGIVAGTQVLVCDNLSFSGEIRFARKHTRFILRDLPEIAHKAVGRLPDYWMRHHRRMLCYQTHELDDAAVHDLVIRAVDNEVCPTTAIPGVLGRWREPPYEAFEARSVWSLQNAFTEVLKGNLGLLPARSNRLHRLLDEYTGFSN